MADEQIANYMKINYLNLDRFIPWLGIAVVAAGVIGVTTYFNFERTARAAEAGAATLERLVQDQQLSSMLKQIHDGHVGEAAQSLDLRLCGDILLTEAELASASPETRMLAQKMFRRIAVARPQTEPADTASAQEHVTDRAAAERILTLALAIPGEVAAK
jgi:hypothetical protein